MQQICRNSSGQVFEGKLVPAFLHRDVSLRYIAGLGATLVSDRRSSFLDPPLSHRFAVIGLLIRFSIKILAGKFRNFEILTVNVLR
jgi:hypothetical protein